VANILGLQTARAGSKSVINKNTILVKGKPLYHHNLTAMLACSSLTDVAVTTDIDQILALKNNNLTLIQRPKSLAGDNASHADAMRHGLEYMESLKNISYDYIALTLGNSVGCSACDLEQAINQLLNDDTYDSVMSVSKFNMFNPNRAYRKNDNEEIMPYLAQKSMQFNNKLAHVNDKDSAGDIYFFNGSFMVFKKNHLYETNGLMPFPWLGHRISHFIQETEMEVDAFWQLDYLMNREK